MTFNIFNSFISDFGAFIAFGLFTLFLSLIGLITIKKNYQNTIFYFLSSLLLISSYYFMHLRIYMNLLFAFLVANALLIFAKCCSPIPGDEIVGYITRGRGVTIHRNTCKNLPCMEGEDRFIFVEWNVKPQSSFIVRLKILLEDRKQLLKDITECISALNINIVSIDMKASDGIATCIIVLEVRDTRQLERLSTRIEKISNFISTERM